MKRDEEGGRSAGFLFVWEELSSGGNHGGQYILLNGGNLTGEGVRLQMCGIEGWCMLSVCKSNTFLGMGENFKFHTVLDGCGERKTIYRRNFLCECLPTLSVPISVLEEFAMTLLLRGEMLFGGHSIFYLILYIFTN